MQSENNPAAAAALELQRELVSAGYPFCFIGGLAVNRWGEPRFTHDADATVLTRIVDDEPIVDHLLDRFRARYPDPREFALRYRVVLLFATNNVPLDIGLGALDFEERCVTRATNWEYRSGHFLTTCTANDLVVHKAFASRDRDWLDIDGILQRQGPRLDVPQILEELRPLAELKEDPNILPRLLALFEKRGIAV